MDLDAQKVVSECASEPKRHRRLPTLFQKVWNLALAELANIVGAAVVAEKGEDVVRKNIGVGIGSVSAMLSVHFRGRSCRKTVTNVFSMRLTIHFFRCGASSSGNNILPEFQTPN